MSLLYCDCFSGISGDMFLGALLDAGLPLDALDEQLAGLSLPGFGGVAAEKVLKGALQATQIHFHLTEPLQAQPERHLHEITGLIQTSRLSEAVKTHSLAIFTLLAEAEAKVHGISVEHVHFHEVGALDSILDIVGAAVGLEYFNVQQVYASALPYASGAVDTRHGRLPLPAPATLELLRRSHAPLVPAGAEVELVTPTGAAILAHSALFEQPAMTVRLIGMGAGQRDLPWPNVLRLLVGEDSPEAGQHVEIETNIDDMNPQLLGHLMGELFQAGALDVYFTPIFMKKNRPATKVSVIARLTDEHALSQALLRQTTTLGVRVKTVHRHEAARELRKVETPYGEAVVKLKILDGKVVGAAPEYDNCVALASQSGVPVAQVYNTIAAIALSLITV